MSEGDSKPAIKLISIESAGDLNLVTIEVSSLEAFLNYTPHHVGQQTVVHVSRSCPLPDRYKIIQLCDEQETLFYESDEDGDDQPPCSDGHRGESSETGHKKEDEKKA